MVKADVPTYTLSEGRPYADPSTAQSFRDGTPVKGLMLLQDTQQIETLAHFNRERIPERVVHGRGSGAWGEFEVTKDTLAGITSAKFLRGVGKKTKGLLRISTVGPESGSADTMRDIRGFAMKLFTEEGNQDWVFNSIPVFFVRDPIKFPSMNRSHKRNPASNCSDPTMFWDFHNNNQEGMHSLMMVFSNRGTPKSIRHVDGFSNHAYKLVNEEDGTFHYAKLHFKSHQGNDGLPFDEAIKLAGENPDSHLADIYQSIQREDFPSWTLYVQLMKPEEAESYRWNIFDITKVWPTGDYPLIEVGKFTLNKNPINYFTDIEQSAFSPSTNVPGIAPPADPMFQSRMFAYPDAQRYRLGVNYQQLPCNRPVAPVYSPYQRDGFMNFTSNYGGDPNYVRSSLKPVAFNGKSGANGFKHNSKHDVWVQGQVQDYATDVTDEDFEQPRMLWEVYGRTGQQDDLIYNLSKQIGKAIPEVQEGAIHMFSRVTPELGERLRAALKRN